MPTTTAEPPAAYLAAHGEADYSAKRPEGVAPGPKATAAEKGKYS